MKRGAKQSTRQGGNYSRIGNLSTKVFSTLIAVRYSEVRLYDNQNNTIKATVNLNFNCSVTKPSTICHTYRLVIHPNPFPGMSAGILVLSIHPQFHYWHFGIGRDTSQTT